MALGDEIQIKISGNADALTSASKQGADAVNALGTAAKKAAEEVRGLGPAVDEVSQPAANEALDNMAKGLRLSAWEAQNLTYQLHDVVTGLISGQRPMIVMLQQGLQISQMFGRNAKLGNVFSLIATSAMEMVNPLNLSVIGIGLAATAVSALWSTWNSGSDKVKADLKEHEKLIEKIKEAYGAAAKSVRAYASESSTVLEFQNQMMVSTLQKDLGDAVSRSIQTIYAEFSRGRTGFVPDFKPFISAIRDLQSSVAAGQPDVDRFRDTVSQIGRDPSASQQVKSLAQTLLATTDAAGQIQAALSGATGAMQVTGQTAIRVAGQVATLTAAMSALKAATPQISGHELIDKNLKDVLSSNIIDGHDAQTAIATANLAHKALAYDDTTQAISRMDAAMREAGKTEIEIARANSSLWEKARATASGVPGVSDKVELAASQARIALRNAEEQAAITAANDRISLNEAREISSIDKLKGKRAELAGLQGSLTGDRANDNAREIARIDEQITSKQISLALEAEKARIATTKEGTAENIALHKQYLADVIKQYGVASEQAIAAQRELDAAMRPRGGGTGTGLSGAASARRLAEEQLRTKEYELAAEVRAGRMSELEKIAIERQLTSEMYEENIKRLSDEQAKLGDGTKAWQKAEQEKLLIKQQEATALAKLDDQAARASEQAAQRSARAWEKATDPIVNGFTGALRNAIQGTQSFRDAMLSMLGDILLQEMEMDIKAFAHHALYAALGLKEDEKAAQGGLLWTIFSQSQKATATAAGVTARTTIEGAGQVATQAVTATGVATHALAETAKTGATAVGAATRTAINASAGAAAVASEGAAMKGGILNHAASAAAATFDAVSQIPIVGYILAPAAAAAAFAGTAAFGSLLSFDVGAWELPHDMVAQVHKGEMIVPATFSDGLRSAMGGNSSGGSGGGDTHVHVNIQAVDAASFGTMVQQHARTIAKHVTAAQALNPSLRSAR